MFSVLARLALAQLSAPDDVYTKDVGSPLGFLEWVDRYSHLVYPGLAALALALMVAAIVKVWKDTDLAGMAKAELKREILLELRRHRGGASAEALAKAVGLEPLRTVKLLEELQRDGLLISHTNTQRLTVWRLKGA